MIWRSKRDKDGRVIDCAWVCEEGYQVTRFTIERNHLYSCYYAGKAIGDLQPTPDTAKALCARHFKINEGRPD